jgi:hypothetical protein
MQKISTEGTGLDLVACGGYVIGKPRKGGADQRANQHNKHQSCRDQALFQACLSFFHNFLLWLMDLLCFFGNERAQTQAYALWLPPNRGWAQVERLMGYAAQARQGLCGFPIQGRFG